MLLILPSCDDGADSNPADGPGDSGQESDADVDADTDSGPELIYPEGDRILLYYGNGGLTEDAYGTGGVDVIDKHWKDKYGWNTDWRDSLGDDLSAFRLIGFMAPGSQGGEPFDQGQLDLLKGAREAGTRLLVLNEVDNCGSEILNGLLEGLGAAPRFSGEGAQQYSVVDSSSVVEDQITAGVSALRLSDPCYVSTNGADSLVQAYDYDLVVRDLPSDGGEVVLVGDVEFFDDSGGMEDADNLLFADRLVEIVPEE